MSTEAARMARAVGRQERRAQKKISARPVANLVSRLQAGVQRQMAGDFNGAAGIYNDILVANPYQPDALHLLGVVCLQTGRYDDAAGLIRKANAKNSRNPDIFPKLAAGLLPLNRKARI